MKHKINQAPDDLTAEIYNQYCGGESIAELSKRFSLSRNKIKTVITKCLCAGADLKIITSQEELAL